MKKLNMTKLLLAMLCLSCGIAAVWVTKASSLTTSGLQVSSAVQRLVPERLRSFVAALIWSRADHYTHIKSSSPVNTGFRPGSYAGNTDILPLMQIIMMLVPDELAVYQLQARNLARYLGQPFKARLILRQAILRNSDHNALYELYASMAFLWIFGEVPSTQQAKVAIKYLDRAISLYRGAESEASSSDPAYSIENFQVLKARLFLELGEPDEALRSWDQSGLPLVGDDKIVQILRDYKFNGTIAPTSAFKTLEELEEQQHQHQQHPEAKVTIEFAQMLRALGIAFTLLVLAAAARQYQLQKLS